jgi:inorganic pyrophosphatase/exopolyphosphatase
MEIIKITKSMKFLLEVDKSLPEREAEELLKLWYKHFPNNQLLILVKGTVKILDIES